MAALQAFEPRILRANAYRAHPQGLRFLEKRSVLEAWCETPVQLDVAEFDPSQYADLETNLRAKGFEIKTFRDMGGVIHDYHRQPSAPISGNERIFTPYRFTLCMLH